MTIAMYKTHASFLKKTLKNTLTGLIIFGTVSLTTDLQANFLCDSELSLGVGYRTDNLHWDISGGQNGPNVLSELEWRKIHSCEISTEYQALFLRNFYARLNGDIAFIFEGQNQDSDYEGNDRTKEYSRSINNADHGKLYDASIGLGMQFSFLFSLLKITPLLGYSYHGQHLTMTDGMQVVDTYQIPQRIGSISGLNSSYTTNWYGPWIGVDFCSDLYKLTLKGGYELHLVNYNASGHWNLRTDFIDDFIHKTNGIGNLFFLKAQYKLTDSLQIGLGARYQVWHARTGLDRTYVKEEIFNALTKKIDFISRKSETKLNKVDWNSFSVSLLATYTF